jgi:LysM repeat protein
MQDKEKFIAQIKESQEKSTLHVVRKGETLASIAKKYHVRTTDIKQWNRLKSNYVKPRQELYVYVKEPKAGNTAETAVAQSDSGKTKSNSKIKVDPAYVISVPLDTFDYKAYYNTLVAQNKETLGTGVKKDNKTVMKDSKVVYHTVRQGDTLWRIANQYKGSSVQQIRKQNNIHNDRSLKPGQKIKISLEG